MAVGADGSARVGGWVGVDDQFCVCRVSETVSGVGDCVGGRVSMLVSVSMRGCRCCV